MIKTLPTLPDHEVQHSPATGDEAGFGAMRTEKGLLPLKALDVRTRIDGLLAETTVTQTFVNSLDVPLEATYIFPLPDRSAVTRFRMEVGGRVIEGILKERGQARREYDQAIQSGHRAAIAEEERPGVFTLRVGNLMPGEEARVRLTLNGPVTYADGEATYRFPLVVAPRYIPGIPLPGASVGAGVIADTDAVPDASRITPPVLLPGFPNPVRLSLAVEVHAAGLALRDLRSSLHAVVTEERDGAIHIALQPGERLNRDFILRFRLGERAVQTALLLHPDEQGQEGTFMLTVVPPDDQANKPRPRDIVFVLDRSGSMGGWKMVAARRALARMVDTLTERDRFAVYAFDDTVETPPSLGGFNLVSATDRNRFRAVEFLAQIDARGGTEMAQPLQQAVNTLAADSERDRILVLVTDGQVGNEDQILRTLAPKLKGLRIFTLGIDQAVNAGFLQRLACIGGGCTELVESEDRLDEVMDKVHLRIGTPVLTNLHVEGIELKIEKKSLTPARLPGLFAGAPLFILGRYHGTGRGSVVLQAHDAAGKPWSEKVQASRSDNSAITSAWARGKVRDLEDRFAAREGNLAALEKEITATSLRFGVLCRFTAFLAVDVKEVVNPGGQVHRVVQPVEAPAGWAMFEEEEDGPCGAGTTVNTLCYSSAEESEFFDLALEDESAEAPQWRAATAPTRKSKGSGGMLGKIARLFSPGSPPAPVPPPPQPVIDLSAYRQRADELLLRLRNCAANNVDRLSELAHLAVRLLALIEDLVSIKAPAHEVGPLQTLHHELQSLLAKPRPSPTATGKLWSQAETVLQAFCQSSSSVPSAERREEFWK